MATNQQQNDDGAIGTAIFLLVLIVGIIYLNKVNWGELFSSSSDDKTHQTEQTKSSTVSLSTELEAYRIDPNHFTWFRIPKGYFVYGEFQKKSDVYIVSFNGIEKRWVYLKYPFKGKEGVRFGLKAEGSERVIYLQLKKLNN